MVDSPSPKTESVEKKDLSLYNGMHESLIIIRVIRIVPFSIRD